MDNKKDLLRVGPVKNYTPPKLPTLDDACGNPPLKVMPIRWKKNAAVIACLGLAGMFTLAGCSPDGIFHHGGDGGGIPFYVACPTENDVLNNQGNHNGEYYTSGMYPAERKTLEQVLTQIETSALDLRTHFGGSGAGPFYVAHITEQEALGFIRARLEAAGLNLDATPPGYSVFGPDEARPGGVSEIGIDLFDADNNVAITSISWEESTQPFAPHGRELATMTAEAFAEQASGISFGVFYNPGETVGWGPFVRGDDDNIQEVTTEGKVEARAILIERLAAQVDEFIAWLQAEGIV